jgi:hypothetical protein
VYGAAITPHLLFGMRMYGYVSMSRLSFLAKAALGIQASSTVKCDARHLREQLDYAFGVVETFFIVQTKAMLSCRGLDVDRA